MSNFIIYISMSRKLRNEIKSLYKRQAVSEWVSEWVSVTLQQTNTLSRICILLTNWSTVHR
jgi:hypothetical protein